MPGANYMGGRRNAAKARIKDTTGRLEKAFFGQRRLCALSKGLLASKPMQRSNVPLEEKLGLADISLGHARRKIPPNNDVSTNVFVPNPIHISPCTPRSRRYTRKKLEAHSSSSNISKSTVLDALDVSEPMFLRGVLDRILTMPDLAGISKIRMKPAVGTGRQPQPSEESSPLQRTKRKRSPSDLYEELDSLSNERSSSSSRCGISHTYKNVCTPPRKKHTSSDHKIAHKERTRSFKKLGVKDNYWESSSSYHLDDYNKELTRADVDENGEFLDVGNGVEGDARLSPSSSRAYMSPRYSPSPKRPSSNYTPYSDLDSRREMTCQTGLPTSIVFRGLKDNSAKQSMAMINYPEKTVYGTLFEQADPWDAIGQILGLSNTKPSKSPGNVIDELEEMAKSMGPLGTHLAIVETEKRDEDLMSEGSDETPQLQYPLLIERQVTGLQQNQAFSRCGSVEGLDRPQEVRNSGTALSQPESPQLSWLPEDVEEIAQVSEEDQNRLSEDIEDKRLLSFTQNILEAPDRRINTRVDSLECSERSICNGEYKSILVIPELQELDGLFMGPSLFDELDEDEI